MSDGELTDALAELGLSTYEAETLVALVRIGSGTARDIADADDVPRTRVYDAVRDLHERGLVDVQQASPKRYTVHSWESIVRTFDVARERTIDRVDELLEELEPVETQGERVGVWTVLGGDTVSQRVVEFVDDAEDSLVYVTDGRHLTDTQVGRLQDAAERGVAIHLSSPSTNVRSGLRETIDDADVFDTHGEWTDTSMGSLLVVDGEAGLVSVYDERSDAGGDETAIWGRGERNCLVAVLRVVVGRRLDADAR